MNNKIIFFLVLFFLAVDCKLPDYLKVCKRDDPQIDKCITESVYALVPNLTVGIPELNVPPLEPFHVKNIIFKSGSEGVYINTILKDISTWKASTFKILHFKSDIPKNKFIFDVRLPQLRLIGNYVMNSKLLAINIVGNGPFNINVTDCHCQCVMKGKKISRNGKTYLKFDKLHMNITIGETKILLENLFNGNHALGEATNNVINDNISLFYESIKPTMEDSISELFTDISNKITEAFDYDELFPK